MSDLDVEEVTRREKLQGIKEALRYRPKMFVTLGFFGVAVAVLEGVGLTFIIPIVEIIQKENPAAQAEGPAAMFVTVYQAIGIPFTLEYVIIGVAAVMTLRYTAGFLYNWFRRIIRFSYQRDLQKRAFKNVIDARIEYFDQKPADEILNVIITEISASSRVLNKLIMLLNLFLLTIAYLSIAIWISPALTVGALGVLGGVTLLFRKLVRPGYELGDLVADANERRQESLQAGVIGIRDIRAFNLGEEIYRDFVDAVEQYTRNKITVKRNETALNKFQNLAVAVVVFGLIYVALQVAGLSFGELGLFLFVMFQIGPRVSSLSQRFYSVENDIPHMIRTNRFIRDLESRQEHTGGGDEVPGQIDRVTFDDVRFAYEADKPVLRDVSFSFSKGEFVAFVGQSGAGKSTIVSLLAQFYQPDSGEIRIDGRPLHDIDPKAWREKLAIVRQNPFIFNDTLRYNLTVGNRDATQAEIDRACKIARVDQFFEELPNGYDSQLGDEGVRLSGGQKQRVALARALLKDAELLILDEATSDLDSNLEKEVQREIEAMDRDYAIITIAHRLSTVENADRIYTMDDGRITERGNHGELVDRDGKYAELYTIQSGD